MQLTTFLSTLLAATAIAVPTTGGGGGGEEDVRGAAVRVEGAVQRHVEVGDGAVRGEDLVQVRGQDVLGELLDDDLRVLR